MDHPSGRGPVRYANGQFGPGNPGRPHGARNRMSGRIAHSLLSHYARHEAEILERLRRKHFSDYMRLIGRMLPQDVGEDAPEPEEAEPQDVARVTRAVRAALERVEAGEGSLDDIEAALAGMGPGEEAP